MSYTIEWEGDPPDTMVDLGGGMVVPLAELAEVPRTQDFTKEASSAVPDVASEQETPRLRHGCKCGARWDGSNTAHCGAQCHLTFTSPSSFDMHRANGVCRPPVSVGLVEHQRVGYTAWGRPSNEERATELNAAREEARR
jgi:hypothetical protein